jgi:hypothetical protein
MARFLLGVRLQLAARALLPARALELSRAPAFCWPRAPSSSNPAPAMAPGRVWVLCRVHPMEFSTASRPVFLLSHGGRCLWWSSSLLTPSSPVRAPIFPQPRARLLPLFLPARRVSSPACSSSGHGALRRSLLSGSLLSSPVRACTGVRAVELRPARSSASSLCSPSVPMAVALCVSSARSALPASHKLRPPASLRFSSHPAAARFVHTARIRSLGRVLLGSMTLDRLAHPR